MFDTTIHAKTIARQFRRSDFDERSWNISLDDKADIVTESVALASRGFTSVALRHNQLFGKSVYRHASLSEALLTRHVSEGVRRITGVRQSDRKAIVKSLAALMAEGLPFGVIKFDIKSFYESVETDLIVKNLRNDAIFSRQSVNVLSSFFDCLKVQGIQGLPRGISLSATLAEYVLRPFDAAISSYEGVRFYSRFVDDGIIVISDKVDPVALIDAIKRFLPKPLVLNRSKTLPFIFEPYSRRSTGALEHTITFLGYSLSISQIISTNNKYAREVHIDIAKSKVAKIKRRIAKSLLEYNNGGKYADLKNRFKLLTSNYGFVDSSTGQQRYSGLRYNYGLINYLSSDALNDLDRFLTNAICSRHPLNRLRPDLSKTQAREILGFGFHSGFDTNRFFAFDHDTLAKIIGCWAHA